MEEVEDEIFRGHDKEVPSSFIGQLVTEKLRRLDQVAYVRFASVYRQFKTLDDLVQEAKAVLDAQRYEVPGQGRLFIEPPKAQATANGDANGSPAEGARKARRGKAKNQKTQAAE